MNGIPYYISQSVIDGNVANARVDKNRFPTGILNLTLFSAENIPVAEILVFIQHHNALQLNLILPVKDYKIRDRVTVNLSAKDAKGKPIVGSNSIAVTDDSKIKEDKIEQQTIFNDLVLTSDLKGKIEKPNYYFINSDPSRQRELDLLMLTQGWSRYSWKDLIRDSARGLPFKPENGININGLISYASKRPVTGDK